MPLTKQLVLFGGSFNPPHIGHAMICVWLKQALNARGIIMVPTFQHAFNKKSIHFDHRFKMCKLLAKTLNGVSVSNIERHLSTPNRTYDTIKQYTCSNLALVIGSDLVMEVHRWYKWGEIQKMVKVIVVGRVGSKDYNIPPNWYHYPITLSSTSSSDIRKMISDNKDIVGLVPSKVEKYIRKNDLYL